MYVVVVLVFSFDFTVLYSIHSIDLIICIGSNNMMYNHLFFSQKC